MNLFYGSETVSCDALNIPKSIKRSQYILVDRIIQLSRERIRWKINDCISILFQFIRRLDIAFEVFLALPHFIPPFHCINISLPLIVLK